jgi:predicted permease
MFGLLEDLRYGIRSWLATPGITAVALLALTLGIGANTAIFTVVDAVLLNSLPYEQSDRLVLVSERSPQVERLAVSLPNFIDWQTQSTSFEHIGIYRRDTYTLTLRDLPEQISGATVSADLLSALRVKPLLGRIFSPDEDRIGSEAVVLLSHGLWQRGLGADPDIVGRKLLLSGKPYTVIGVMDTDYAFPDEAELWVPIGPQFNNIGWQERRNHPGLYAVARLRPGVTLEQARVELTAVAARLEQQYPASNTGIRVNIEPMLDAVVRDIRPLLWSLFGVVGFVLLLACANVANLSLGRVAARQKEIAIRGSLGASRLRILRQLLVESTLLSLAGAALGIVVARFGVDALLAANPVAIPRAGEIGLDLRVVVFTSIVAVLTGVVFGLAPALQASRLTVGSTVNESSHGSKAGVKGRLRRGLVVAEVALSIVPLIGAGLMIRSLALLTDVTPGFEPENLLSLQINLPRTQYAQAPQRVNFYRQLLERLAAVPGVQSSAVATGLPLGNNGNSRMAFHVTGQPEPRPGQAPLADLTYVSNDYFQAMNIPRLQGRTFTDHDDRDAPPVVIVDEFFAKRYWPGEDAVGKQVTFVDDPSPRTVIGVVGRVKMDRLEDDSSRGQAYFSYLVSPWGFTMSIVARAADPVGVSESVRREVLALDKDRPIYNVRTMERVREQSIAARWLNTLVFGAFAAIALLLASVGVYSVMSYSVSQRTREIGIRIALGADRGSVFSLLVRQGIAPALIGVAIGLAAALAMTRGMQSLLFGVSAFDAMTFLLVPVLLVSVALLACVVPARKALNIEPREALRYE